MNVDNWKIQLRKGVLDLVILNILTEKSLYGLEMIQKMEFVEGLEITEGTIYPLLSRLKTDGLVFSEWVESDQGRPRKYYSLSEKGRRAVTELNDAWLGFVQSINKTIEGSKK